MMLFLNSMVSCTLIPSRTVEMARRFSTLRVISCSKAPIHSLGSRRIFPPCV
jgi:hypothetical protein